MKKSRLVTFIGSFYIFGGVIVLLSLLFNGSQLNTVFDLPNIPDYIVKLLVGIIYIPLGYLYIKRIKASNWIVLVLALIFFCISADLATKYDAQPYIGNLIYTLLVIVVTVNKRKEFTKDLQTIFRK